MGARLVLAAGFGLALAATAAAAQQPVATVPPSDMNSAYVAPKEPPPAPALERPERRPPPRGRLPNQRLGTIGGTLQQGICIGCY
jgi:hypothetical protein